MDSQPDNFLLRQILKLTRRTGWLLFFVLFTATWAQSIDPLNEFATVHIHPENDIIGVTNGRVFETYTFDFAFISQFTLLNDPSIVPTQYNFQWTPDGSKLAVILYGVPIPPTATILQIWDVITGEKLYEIPGVDVFASVAWSPDGTKFAARVTTSDLTDVVRVYDAQTGEIVVEILSGDISQLAWSSSGDQLVFDGGRDNIQVFNADTGQPVQTLDAQLDSEINLAFSPTENLLAFVNLTNDVNTLEIWNTDTGQLVYQLQGDANRIIDFNWNTGGLVSTSADDTIRIWDVQTGEQIHIFQAGRYPRAELNADGTQLLVKDDTIGIHMRDAITGEILAVFGSAITLRPIFTSTNTASATDIPTFYSGEWFSILRR